MNKRVLFVDDEPMVLNGLRRMAMTIGRGWEAKFASSGQEAMELMATEHFDVVVSDMRMPGMDGAELLNKTMSMIPDSVRIILSGQSEQDAIMRCVGITHQFLSKPCSADMLRTTIERASSLRQMLKNRNIEEVVSKITTLPSMPTMYLEIIKELHSPNVSTKSIAKIISKDAGMLAKVLQLVNSAFFISCTLGKEITDPLHAVNALGLDIISALVLSAKVFSQFPVSIINEFALQEMMQHSLSVGGMARAIARSQNQSARVIDNCCAAGIMHDLGIMIFASNMPEVYRKVIANAAKKQQPLWMAEWDTFGTTHGEVGAYLLGLWGLPDAVVEAVAYHHAPEKCHHSEFCPITAVHVADVIDSTRHADKYPYPAAQYSESYLCKLKLKDQVAEWERIVDCENDERKAA